MCVCRNNLKLVFVFFFSLWNYGFYRSAQFGDTDWLKYPRERPIGAHVVTSASLLSRGCFMSSIDPVFVTDALQMEEIVGVV